MKWWFSERDIPGLKAVQGHVAQLSRASEQRSAELDQFLTEARGELAKLSAIKEVVRGIPAGNPDGISAEQLLQTLREILEAKT
jgi:hypothetical protein